MFGRGFGFWSRFWSAPRLVVCSMQQAGWTGVSPSPKLLRWDGEWCRVKGYGVTAQHTRPRAKLCMCWYVHMWRCVPRGIFCPLNAPTCIPAGPESRLSLDRLSRAPALHPTAAQLLRYHKKSDARIWGFQSTLIPGTADNNNNQYQAKSNTLESCASENIMQLDLKATPSAKLRSWFAAECVTHPHISVRKC